MVNARSGIHSFDAEQEGDLAITEVHTDAIVVTERILFMLNTPRRCATVHYTVFVQASYSAGEKN